jgi:hypothetical protein
MPVMRIRYLPLGNLVLTKVSTSTIINTLKEKIKEQCPNELANVHKSDFLVWKFKGPVPKRYTVHEVEGMIKDIQFPPTQTNDVGLLDPRWKLMDINLGGRFTARAGTVR